MVSDLRRVGLVQGRELVVQGGGEVLEAASLWRLSLAFFFAKTSGLKGSLYLRRCHRMRARWTRPPSLSLGRQAISGLALKVKERDAPHMTQKELVLDAISELPNDASLDEIAERVDFLTAIQKGFDQLDRGEGISHEEIKRQLASWLTN